VKSVGERQPVATTGSGQIDSWHQGFPRSGRRWLYKLWPPALPRRDVFRGAGSEQRVAARLHETTTEDISAVTSAP